MNRWWLVLVAGVVGVALCGGAFLTVRRSNHRLEARLRIARAEHAELARRHGENVTLRRIATRAQTDAAGAARELDGAIARTRDEIAALEQLAQRRYETKVATQRLAQERLARNRDLTRGPVLVENCANVGQATAVDAFQTLVWASTRGDDETVARMIAMDDAAREKLSAVLAGLSEAQRAKFPTPESFVALFIADNVTNVASVHVVKQTQPTPDLTLLEIARMDGKLSDLPLHRGPDGWQVAVDANAAKKISRYLTGTPGAKR